MGARPVERFLEGTVVTKLSRMLISGELTSGTVVHIEAAAAAGTNDDTTTTKNTNGGTDKNNNNTSGSPITKKPRINNANTTTMSVGGNLRYRVEHDAAYEVEKR